MPYEFYLSVDVRDKSSQPRFALVEKHAASPNADPDYHVRSLGALQATDPPEVARHVQRLIADNPYTGRTLVIVSRPDNGKETVLDALVDRGLTPIDVTVTAGQGTGGTGAGITTLNEGSNGEAHGFTVGSRTLAQALHEIYSSTRLKAVDENLTQADDLMRGLGDEQADADNPWVRTVGLACWFAESRSFDPAQTAEDLEDEDVVLPGELKPAVP